MREIIFRGKSKESGEWIYGVPCYFDDSRHIVKYLYNAEGGYVVGAESEEVIPDTIGQYTGLTANGTKIFEGDICRHFANYSGKNIYAPIVFELGMFWLKYSEKAAMPLCDVCEKVEVVGNIHDNPELLKGR